MNNLEIKSLQNVNAKLSIYLTVSDVMFFLPTFVILKPDSTLLSPQKVPQLWHNTFLVCIVFLKKKYTVHIIETWPSRFSVLAYTSEQTNQTKGYDLYFLFTKD